MKTARRSYSGEALGFILLVAVAVAVVYALTSHLLIVNSCGADTTLIFDNGSGICLTHNSSAAFYGGKLIPLTFSFVNGSPLLYIWNQPVTESANSYVFLSIPDTFKVHMQYNSTVGTRFMVMTNQQYVSWVNSGGTDTTNEFSLSGKQVSGWFNDSAGCAGYVAVIFSTSHSGFTIYPNETALYAPAQSPTGVCS